MRLTRVRFSILLFLGLALIMLSACSSEGSDPVVTPDTTIPSTLKVTVTIVEDQDASDGLRGKSVITLGFSTNEIAETNTVIFTHGESVSCNGSRMTLGNATSYWFRVAIPYDSLYTCTYYYFLSGRSEHETIFMVHAAQHPLAPVLVRPVNGTFQVRYTPGPGITNSFTCKVQVTANASNGNAMGDNKLQNGRYSGPDVSSLSGAGNIMMKRTCMPVNFDHHNSANDHGPQFDAVNVTYISTASYEVSWSPADSSTQGINP